MMLYFGIFIQYSPPPFDCFWLRLLVCLVDHGNARGPGSTAPLSAFKRVVRWSWNGHTVLTGSLTFVHWVGDDVIPRSPFLCELTLDAEPLGPFPFCSRFFLYRRSSTIMSWSTTHILFGSLGHLHPNVHFPRCSLQGSNPCRWNPNNKY